MACCKHQSLLLNVVMLLIFCGCDGTQPSNPEVLQLDSQDEQTSKMSEFPSDMRSFSERLATEISNGDTIETVESILGPGLHIDDETRRIALEAVSRWQIDDPDLYRDGVRNSDELLRWKIPDGCTLQLQFRDGRLVNHVPESYAHSGND